MRLGDGTPREKLLLAAVVFFYAQGVAIALTDHAARIGQPDPGWNLSWNQITPTRPDAAALGLRGGGELISVNGARLAQMADRSELVPAIRRGLGEHNALVVRRAGGGEVELSIPVRPLRPDDVLYSDGATIALGVLFFAVGLWTFVLRPWESSSWALLSLCTVFGGALWNLFPDLLGRAPLSEGYLRTTIGMLAASVVHAALAFPKPHRILDRGRAVVVAIYAGGGANAVAQLHAWRSDWAGPWRYLGSVDTGLLLIAILFFVARCAGLSMRRQDPLISQRARILLAGTVFGGAIPVAVRFVQLSFGGIDFDPRFSFWSLAILLLALARTTLRTELMNARVAVQRAVIYGAAVVGLTGLAIALSSFSPYAVAVLLLPLLYLWPRFEARLNERFYPKRLHLAELSRQVADEMASADKVPEVLDVLARGVTRVLDASSSIAFLLPDDGESPIIGSTPGAEIGPGRPLVDEPLIQLLVTTRREVLRDQVDVEPQYIRIREDTHRCFERLGAELMCPIQLGGEVIGGITLGPRTTRDPYDAFEVEVLGALAQSAVQDIRRIRAVERLREREGEFQDLQRFFPPQIIEQVLARGGASELRSQRKRVTVLFADLRGFTSFSERVEPEEVMSTLAEYHDAMGERIGEFGGTLERFAGDGFMVFFNDPVEQPDHAARAARMALAMQTDVARLRQRWARVGYDIHVGIGVASGYATVGFIGYEGRRDYGVIGNVTNLAARLSDLAEPGEILLSAVSAADLPEDLEVESAGEHLLAGFSQPQRTFRLLRAE